MTLMQLIKTVLDEAYAQIEAKNDGQKDELIAAAMEELTKEYGELGNPDAPEIDYRNPVKRFAYIYRYTVAHADYVMQLIEQNEAVAEILSRKKVAVACLGGGPGSDFLGIMKYMIKRRIEDTKLLCQIFDKERAWADSWSDVAAVLDVPFEFYPSFMQMDVLDKSTWESYKRLAHADLITLSFFISELWRFGSAAEPFFDHCMAEMKPGAVMVFIDNNSSMFVEWFDSMAEKHDFEWLEKSSEVMVFSNNEQTRDLGIYFEKFDWPKRKGNVALRILRKR